MDAIQHVTGEWGGGGVLCKLVYPVSMRCSERMRMYSLIDIMGFAHWVIYEVTK